MDGNGNGMRASRDGARDLMTHARTLVELELELAKLEVRHKAQAAALGAGFGAAAGVFAGLMVVFLFAAAAAGISTQLPVWASILIVAGALGLLAALTAFIAMRLLKKGTPPVPDRAIEEAIRTKDAVQRI
jgi:membrane protein